ncbi:MAG TPA: methionyl-tRNA formyltransferase [Methylomirabilota bacterium]|nr:methionyl-tRNA formyltransferase [Methylomirabilota bacterium]
MKVLFYGTPEFALPALHAIRSEHTIVSVITQPDRPAHRGQKLTPPPVKVAALAAGLPVLQPPRLRDPEWPETLRGLGADVAVVVAFGQILPQAVLDAPARGSINIHASLLPKYRGAAPIQWAIIRGETVTGITTFQMDAGMDTGAMLLQAETAIGAEETAGELGARLAPLGARLILDTLARLGTLRATPQPEGATLAPRLKKTDGALDWTRPACDLVNLVRGCNPWPGAAASTPGSPLAIWRARAIEGAGTPGTLIAHERTLAIATGTGALLPLEVQAEGRKALTWDDYRRGARLVAGRVLSTS